MPIIFPNSPAQRGQQDAKRHRDKQREAIKKRLPELLTEENIITGPPDKKMRIPIRGIDIPHFRPIRDTDETGIGQGPGEAGDMNPGDEHAEHQIETEMTYDEIAELIFTDCGLPRFEDREARELLVTLGLRVHGTQRTGPQVLLKRRKTAEELIRRFWEFLNALMQETGQEQIICYRALKQANGIYGKAKELILSGSITLNDTEVSPFPVPTVEDLRYHKLEEDMQKQSQAVVVLAMDVSGSMDDEKKYLVRALSFWLVGILRRLYNRVEVRFIIHDTEAEIVDELAFFTTTTGGGTQCFSAYETAESLLKSDYPAESWNQYVWHFSDGEDYSGTIDRTVAGVKALLTHINMLGYGEVSSGGNQKTFQKSDLWEALCSKLGLQETFDSNMELNQMTKADIPLLGVHISQRKHILPALKTFLMKDRWVR